MSTLSPLTAFSQAQSRLRSESAVLLFSLFFLSPLSALALTSNPHHHTEILQDMDAEELLRQVQIRCGMLEADLEAETMRAAKYREILATLAGEGSGVTQPEASRVRHAARSALTRPTLPAASRPSDPEVLTITRRPSADPPMARKRDSSSAENCARSSKRTRRFSNVPQSSSSKPCDTTRTLVPGMDVEGIFECAGLTPLVLTRAEASRAEETPGITWTMFFKVFGGTMMNSEWPQCSKVPGYEEFLCTGTIAQPYMPLVPGKPGVFLRLPAVIETPQSDHDKSTFHVLSAMRPKGALHYRGKYRKIPLPQVQFTWTNLLQKRSQEKWFKRVLVSSAMRATRARIALRNEIEREPSASEVKAYMYDQFKDQITYKEVSAAFRTGKETLTLEGIECIEYDSQLATMIQRAVQGNDI
ncbi:hypothetical protein V8E52_005574 [Russula decolorans]